MSQFAENLFGGGRFLRVSLFLASAAASVLFAVLPYEWNPKSTAVFVVVELALLLLALAMVAPRRFHWAGRALAGLVFLSYAAYVAIEFSEESTLFPKRRSEASLGNALMGFVVIGIPGLVYALRARRPGEMLPPEADRAEDV